MRILCVIAGIVLFACALRAQKPNDLNQTMKNAVAAYQAGLFYEAEEHFQAIDRARPNVPDVLHGLAMCAFQTHRYDPAVGYFKRLLALPKPQAQFINIFGSVYDEMGLPDQALPLYEQALTIDPKFTAAWFGSGRIMARRGNAEEARRRLQKAVELDPKHVEAHYELASVEFAAGNSDEAEKLAQRVIALSPRHVGARFLIARIALKAKRTEEGKKLLLEAQQMQKEEDRRALDRMKIGSYLDLAFGARRRGEITESIAYFGEILKIDRRHAQARSALESMEQVLRNAGRTADADLCRKTLDRKP